MRPVILNGIDDLAVRDDLADRTIVINLARIPDVKRKSKRELLQRFDLVRPTILGALLDVLSKALANLSTVQLSSLPRMADFAQLISAAEPALGWSPGTFLSLYTQDRAETAAGFVESDSVAVAVLDLMKAKNKFSGTATELLAVLSPGVDPEVRQARAWPQTPQALSGRIRRAAPALRSSGIEVDFDRESHSRGRLIILRFCPLPSVPSDPSGPLEITETSQSEGNKRVIHNGLTGDTGDDNLRSHDLPPTQSPIVSTECRTNCWDRGNLSDENAD